MSNPSFYAQVISKLERIETLILRQRAFANGDEPPAFEPGDPMCRDDIEEMLQMADRLRLHQDRPGGTITEDIEDWQIVASRAELCVYMAEIRRLWAKVDRLEEEQGLLREPTIAEKLKERS